MSKENYSKESYNEAYESEESLRAQITETKSADEIMVIAMKLKEVEGKKSELENLAQEEAIVEDSERTKEKEEAENKLHEEALADNEEFDKARTQEKALKEIDDGVENLRKQLGSKNSTEELMALASQMRELENKRDDLLGKGIKVEIKNEDKEKREEIDPRLEKYMGTIRESLSKMKALRKEENEIRASGKFVSNENMSNLTNNILRGRDAESKSFIDLPKKEPGESEYEYTKRVDKIKEEFKEAVKDNREIMLAFTEAGQIVSLDDLKYGVSDRLRGDKDFIREVIQAIKNNGSRSYANGMIWGSVRGEAGTDKDLYLEAVKLNPLNYQFGLKEWKKDLEVQRVAQESGLDTAYLEK